MNNKLDKQYTDLLQDILDNGVKKQDRTGTGTLSVFGRQIRHNMKDGFPLLTTKKMPFKTIVTELLWFLKGDTNIKYLVDNGCNIWTGDAHKNYLKEKDKVGLIGMDIRHFLINIARDDKFAKKWGELGKIYGFQWRNWGGWKDTKQTGFLHKTDNGWTVKWSDLHSFANGTEWLTTPIQDSDQSLYSDEDEGKKVYYKNITLGYDEKSFYPIQVAKVIDDKFNKYVGGIDQIANLINELKTNPDSRRLMVTAWNPGQLDEMVLPPCHTDFQFYTRELSLEERLPKKIKLKGHGDEIEFSLTDKREIKYYGKTKESNESLERVEKLKNNEVFYQTEFGWGVFFNTDTFETVSYDGTEWGGQKLNIPTRAISLIWNQRSVDTGLGLGFNIASYGLLLEMIAKQVNMIPDELIGNLGDVHLYLDHLEPIKEQLNRKPFELPALKIHNNVDDISHYKVSDFELIGYQSHPTIKLPLSN
jgi:thymidylate synthase